MWLGGFLAVYLYNRYEKGATVLTQGQGAGLGAVAGVIGAFIGVFVYIITSFISAPIMNAIINALDLQGDLPFGTGFSIGSTIFFFGVDIILYPLIGALSGLISTSILKK